MKTIFTALYGQYINLLAFVAPRKAGKIGFGTFCRPFRAPITPKQLAFFNTAEKFSIRHDGHVVHAYKWGKGDKKVLFLHGWQSHTYRWKVYIEAIPQDEFTVYALDAPGHGLSSGNFLSVPLYSDVIKDFIRETGPMHAVAAHSLGGFSLLYTLYQNPSLPVDRVVLMAPPGEAQDFIDVFRKTLGLSARALKHIVNHFVQTYDVPPTFFSLSKFASNVNVKGVIIHDEDDREAPYHYSPQLNKAWKHSRLITTKGFGHNLKSPSVVQEVVGFISERENVSARAAMPVAAPERL